MSTGLDQHAKRLLTELVTEATAACRLRRAQQFLDSRPRLDDFHGNATPDELRAAWRRCNQIAVAFRASAEIAPIREAVETDAANVWAEAS